MKKLLFGLMVVLFSFTLLSCDSKADDEAVEKAATRLYYDGLDAIKGNMTFDTKLANGVTASYESSNEDVLAFDGGEAIVNRPAKGEGNCDLTITATVSKGKAKQTKEFEATVLESNLISIAEAISKTDGEVVDIQGVIHGFVRKVYNNELSYAGVYITDATGTIYIYDFKLAEQVKEGDEVVISGELASYGGKQLKNCALIDTVATEQEYNKSNIVKDKTIAEIYDLASPYNTIYEVSAILRQDEKYGTFSLVDGNDKFNIYLSGIASLDFNNEAYGDLLSEYVNKEVTVYFLLNSKSGESIRGLILEVLESAELDPNQVLADEAIAAVKNPFSTDAYLEDTDVTLPTAKDDTVTFTYTTNNTEEDVIAIVSGVAEITVPKGKVVEVKVTLTVTVGTCIASKTFYVTVGKDDAPIEEISIADFLNLTKGDTYYQLKGKVINITGVDYGNFDLVSLDNPSDSVYVYGLTAEKSDKNDKSFGSLGIVEGDIVTIVGVRDEHNSKPQVGGPAYFISKTSSETTGPTEPTTPISISSFKDLAVGESASVIATVIMIPECETEVYFIVTDGNSNLVVNLNDPDLKEKMPTVGETYEFTGKNFVNSKYTNANAITMVPTSMTLKADATAFNAPEATVVDFEEDNFDITNWLGTLTAKDFGTQYIFKSAKFSRIDNLGTGSNNTGYGYFTENGPKGGLYKTAFEVNTTDTFTFSCYLVGANNPFDNPKCIIRFTNATALS